MFYDEAKATEALQNQVNLSNLIESAYQEAMNVGVSQLIPLINKLVIKKSVGRYAAEPDTVFYKYYVVTPRRVQYVVGQQKADELLANNHAQIFRCEPLQLPAAVETNISEPAEI